LVHLDHAKIYVVGYLFFRCGAWPLNAVKIKPFVDETFNLEALLQFTQVESLLLEGSPELFDEDIIEIAVETVHGLDLSRFCAAPGARLSHLPFERDRTFPTQC
jgi:hypothetical protein